MRRTITSIITALLLMVSFVGAGLFVCAFPPTTTVLATLASQDYAQYSTFNSDELVDGAQATREYTVGNHNLDDLLLAEARMHVSLYNRDRSLSPLTSSDISTLQDALEPVTGTEPNYTAVQTVMNTLDDRFALDSDAISHLDDVYGVVHQAELVLIGIFVLAIIGVVILVRSRRPRYAGITFLVSGLLVLAAFAAVGFWAATDFTGFFAAFHGLFFSAGSWTFNYDSLLICMLSQNFWIGMGITWLATTAILSLIFIIIGVKYLRKG